MKQWLDYLPLIVFFIVFKLKGIFPATAVLIAGTIAVCGYIWFSEGKLSKRHQLTLLLTLVFGGMTLYFHDATFLKWKATLIDWAIAIFFLGSHFVGEQLAVQRLLGHAVQLPATVWKRLNTAWGVFFAALGGTSLYVAFHTDTNTWVNFKVFGTFGLTFLFVVAQMLYINRYIKPENSDGPQN